METFFGGTYLHTSQNSLNRQNVWQKLEYSNPLKSKLLVAFFLIIKEEFSIKEFSLNELFNTNMFQTYSNESDIVLLQLRQQRGNLFCRQSTQGSSKSETN